MTTYPWLTIERDGRIDAVLDGVTEVERDRRMVIVREIDAGRLALADDPIHRPQELRPSVEAPLRRLARMNLPTTGDGVAWCPFCDWQPEHGAHDDECVITLAAVALGQQHPWHDVDGRRCSTG